jgi:hypothetical protein
MEIVDEADGAVDMQRLARAIGARKVATPGKVVRIEVRQAKRRTPRQAEERLG